jgi:hypothetical protein
MPLLSFFGPSMLQNYLKGDPNNVNWLSNGKIILFLGWHISRIELLLPGDTATYRNLKLGSEELFLDSWREVWIEDGSHDMEPQ